MPIFRNDQAVFSFASEAGLGGFFETASGSLVGTPFAQTLSAAANPGDRKITVSATTNLSVGDYIRIGDTATTDNQEIRKVTAINSNTLTLNQPLGFPHANVEDADEIDTSTITGTNYIKFLPGVWETIEVPDPEMEIEGKYFMGSASKRNFFAAYKGRQSFTGTIPSFMILNGFPLRFPFGTVATTGTDDGAGTGTLNGAHTKGDLIIAVSGASGFSVNEYVQIGTGSTSEVREIIAINTNDYTLDYPLMFDHSSGEALNEVIAPFTHTISEAVELDSVSWHVKNVDSGETVANNWYRRYIGGKVSQATITAEQGDVLRMSWEGVPFIDMIHNQKDSSATSGDVPKFHAGVQDVTPTLTTEDPYYFSQGAITLFGVEFARIISFAINVNNNVEPHYFIRDEGTDRIPAELYENRREYSMTATIVLPDAATATASTRTLFKELLTEGDYGSGMQGFDISLVFTRGASDTLTITIPPSTAATGGNAQGAYVRSANTSVNPTDNPARAEVDILFRSLEMTVVDSIATYP